MILNQRGGHAPTVVRPAIREYQELVWYPRGATRNKLTMSRTGGSLASGRVDPRTWQRRVFGENALIQGILRFRGHLWPAKLHTLNVSRGRRLDVMKSGSVPGVGVLATRPMRKVLGCLTAPSPTSEPIRIHAPVLNFLNLLERYRH